MASGDGQALPVSLPGARYLALATGTGQVSPLVTTSESPPQRGLRRDCNGGRLACEHSAPLAITPRLSVRPPDGHIRLMKVRAAESDVVKFLRTAPADGAHYGNCRATKSRRLGRSGKRHHHIVFQAIGLRGLLA